MSTNHSKQFSRDCMVQALIQLLQTKSLSNITISELTERAGVSRMTYYRNYNSMDEIFISYLKDLVDAYRQDVAAWPDKGNYNDYRNMLHCYEYFDHYREFIACLVNTGLGHLLLQALDSYILDTYYTEDKGRDFYYTLRAFSGSLYNIYVTWIMEIPWNPLKRSYPLSVRSIPDHDNNQQRTAQNTQSLFIFISDPTEHIPVPASRSYKRDG